MCLLTYGTGSLILITQLWRRLDIIAREMCTMVIHHRCWYVKNCTSKKCKFRWIENSDMSEPVWHCVRCGNTKLKISGHRIERRYFHNMLHFQEWNDFKSKPPYKTEQVIGIEKVFELYDTYQLDNLFSDIYL
jgi:hypothetical protein